MKQCTKCKQTLPDDKFHKNSGRPSGLADWCKSCRKKGDRNSSKEKARNKKYRDANKDKQRAYHVKRKYGVSIEEYNSVLSIGKCEVCGSSDDLVYHHHHETTKAACLCRKCNAGIGLLQDNAKLLLRAYELQRKLEVLDE